MTEKARGGIPREQWLLATVCVNVAAVVSLIPQAAAPAVPAMARHFAAEGGGEFLAQMVVTAPALTMIIGAPLAGAFADRFGHRLTLFMSLVLFLIGGAGVLFINDIAALIVLRLILGLAGGAVFTLGLALISENFAGHAREHLFGFVVLVASAWAVTANTFGGALVDWFGWRAPFALYLVAVPLFIVAWRVVRNPVSAGHPERVTVAGHLRHLAPVATYYFMLMLLSIGIFLPYIQAGLVLEERGITSAAVRGAIVSTTGLLSASSGFLYGYFRRRLSASAVMANNAFCIGTGIIIIAFAPEPWTVVLGCALIGFGAGMCTPATASLAVSLTPAPVHALALGLSFSAINMGEFINPIVLAPLKEEFGTAAAFAMFASLLIAFGLFIVLSRGRSYARAAVQPADAD